MEQLDRRQQPRVAQVPHMHGEEGSSWQEEEAFLRPLLQGQGLQYPNQLAWYPLSCQRGKGGRA